MLNFLEIVSNITTAIIGSIIFAIAAYAIYAYVRDKHHPTSALRRSFPFVIRFRYSMEKAGEFLRQYLFTSDREEQPFNREQRRWAYRASDNEHRTIAFGSTHKIDDTNEFIFKPSLYPTLDGDTVKPVIRTIGEHCEYPYTAKHLFNASAMSYGSISRNAVLALSQGLAKSGHWMNTGEGGITQYHIQGGADLVVQIGTANYGCRKPNGDIDYDQLKKIAELKQVKMFELKLSQGAKAGKGGILPANKVTAEIAEIRGIKEGEDSVSPNRHKSAGTPDEILELVYNIRKATGKPCGIKLCLGNIDELEELVKRVDVKRGPDFITVDGGEGGTGASPASLMDHVGTPLFEALPLVVGMLQKYGLRDSIEIIASGKLITPDKVAAALAYGADFCVSARGFMFSLGCIQALHCNTNKCPTGITTQDERLQKNLIIPHRAKRVASYADNMEYEVGMIAHSCGCKSPRELTREHLLHG